MLEARLIDRDGEEAEIYEWDTYDSEEALAWTYERAEEDGIDIDGGSIHIYQENGEHVASVLV